MEGGEISSNSGSQDQRPQSENISQAREVALPTSNRERWYTASLVDSGSVTLRDVAAQCQNKPPLECKIGFSKAYTLRTNAFVVLETTAGEIQSHVTDSTLFPEGEEVFKRSYPNFKSLEPAEPVEVIIPLSPENDGSWQIAVVNNAYTKGKDVPSSPYNILYHDKMALVEQSEPPNRLRYRLDSGASITIGEPLQIEQITLRPFEQPTEIHPVSTFGKVKKVVYGMETLGFWDDPQTESFRKPEKLDTTLLHITGEETPGIVGEMLAERYANVQRTPDHAGYLYLDEHEQWGFLHTEHETFANFAEVLVTEMLKQIKIDDVQAEQLGEQYKRWLQQLMQARETAHDRESLKQKYLKDQGGFAPLLEYYLSGAPLTLEDINAITFFYLNHPMIEAPREFSVRKGKGRIGPMEVTVKTDEFTFVQRGNTFDKRLSVIGDGKGDDPHSDISASHSAVMLPHKDRTKHNIVSVNINGVNTCILPKGFDIDWSVSMSHKATRSEMHVDNVFAIGSGRLQHTTIFAKTIDFSKGIYFGEGVKLIGADNNSSLILDLSNYTPASIEQFRECTLLGGTLKSECEFQTLRLKGFATVGATVRCEKLVLDPKHREYLMKQPNGSIICNEVEFETENGAQINDEQKQKMLQTLGVTIVKN